MIQLDLYGCNKSLGVFVNDNDAESHMPDIKIDQKYRIISVQDEKLSRQKGQNINMCSQCLLSEKYGEINLIKIKS